MRPDPWRQVLAVLCMAAIGGAPAHAANADEPAAPPADTPSDTHIGGVAETRALWLAPGGEPRGRVQQAGLRLMLEHTPPSDHTVVLHAQGQWMHSSDRASLQRLSGATPSLDRARSLAWRRDGERQQRSATVDWLYLHGPWQHGRYSLGRQPINASLGRLWSPVDLFAPFHPDDLERLYKPGVDAAQLQWFIDERVRSTTIASAARSPEPGRSLRWQWQQRLELEVPWGKAFALAGARHEQKLLGGGAQFNGLAGHDVYAEMLWHRGPQADPAIGDRRSGVRTLLGATRKLADDTQGTLEWLHQSRGISDPSRYGAYTLRAATLDLPYIGTGRHYLGASVSARPHPLWGLDALLLGNLSDRSASLTLALEHTPQPNLKLRASVAAPVAGRSATEYRRQGRALHIGAQWFF
jgi:hypothetical protein